MISQSPPRYITKFPIRRGKHSRCEEGPQELASCSTAVEVCHPQTKFIVFVPLIPGNGKQCHLGQHNSDTNHLESMNNTPGVNPASKKPSKKRNTSAVLKLHAEVRLCKQNRLRSIWPLSHTY